MDFKKSYVAVLIAGIVGGGGKLCLSAVTMEHK